MRQAVQPFEPRAAHPGGRAGGRTGLEIKRGADAQADAAGVRLLGDGVGQQFLQR
jgi:hypothetical protein